MSEPSIRTFLNFLRKEHGLTHFRPFASAYRELQSRIDVTFDDVVNLVAMSPYSEPLVRNLEVLWAVYIAHPLSLDQYDPNLFILAYPENRHPILFSTSERVSIEIEGNRRTVRILPQDELEQKQDQDDYKTN